MTTRRANPSITGAPRPMHTSTRLSASRVFEILCINTTRYIPSISLLRRLGH